MTINVTQEHIKQGCRVNCAKCPVALALKERTGDLWLVGGSYIRRNGHNDLIELPAVVTQWILDFDDGIEVQPFSFELEIPA